MTAIERVIEEIDRAQTLTFRGKVRRVVGLTIESRGPMAKLGDLCRIHPEPGKWIMAEVVGFRGGDVLLMPLGDMDGIAPGSDVVAAGRPFTVAVGMGLLGRVLDGLGRPIDGGPPVQPDGMYPAHNSPPQPLKRARIRKPLGVGVRAIDGLLTCGRGQRLGIFSGSGVGKSTLLGMIARNTQADVSVIGLVGERGREVREFVEKDLGPEGLSRSVVVAATSDQPALVRIKAAFVATAVAEFFRDRGMDVVLMMDSVTRFAMAQREVGLAVGEPPATRGYTPSVFALLPKLLERSGTATRGSITGFYTVLVDGDDMNEPIADAVRGILDGHIVLSRELAAQGHYPAIDVLQSVSRVMVDIVGEGHVGAAVRARAVLATYREAEDLINIGAYVPGSNPRIDYARKMIDRVNSYLRQGTRERCEYEESVNGLEEMFRGAEAE
ncbi:MAG: flagellar protein export ATPase FliI [Firmicutes bacterium]|nr:flagellar protein export ATPase FliI [Bacillota bacterium]